MNVRGKHIFVGLSGGVDSAVSAALLKRAGAHVTGVFIKGWYPPRMPCTWAADRRDAMRVAARLQIPFITLDASSEYKQSVIDYLLAEYRAGRTPNPDIMCNRDIKFGAFYRFARSEGAEAIATGHYLAGEKDQRYFLWAVPKEVLGAALFPVGQLPKTQVRSLAKQFNLPVAQKRDSQGVCFLGSVSVEEFLRSELRITPGVARDTHGTIVGEHGGALLYTIGQRVALRDLREAGSKQQTTPWFVQAINADRNELVVYTDQERSSKEQLKVIRFAADNWFQDRSAAVQAQYRYRGIRVRGRVRSDAFESDESLFERPAPGQSIVFYDAHDALVGGGIIAA